MGGSGPDMRAYRIKWQAQAGLGDVSVWSAIAMAESEADARELIWRRIRSAGMRSEAMDMLEVEALLPTFVHIQKGELWGEPWSVELQFRKRLDQDQLAMLARRLARFEMTQPLEGEAVRSVRLSVPALAADEARSRALTLVRDALGGGEHIEVTARTAQPVWVWEQNTLDST
jgi:hypothetical protein